jgi:malonate transporter
MRWQPLPRRSQRKFKITMISILSALAPLFGLIVIGYLLKSRSFLDDGFWSKAEWLTFYILFPSLLVTRIGGAETAGSELLPMSGALITAMLIVSGAVTVARPSLFKRGLSGPASTSVFQGAIRPGTYVAFGAAYALYGDEGLALTAAAIIAVIPLGNILSVIALHIWTGQNATSETQPDWRDAILPVFKNPIILACLVGAGFNISGFGLPAVIGPLLNAIASAALPLGLMAVGAGLDFNAVRDARGFIAATTITKLMITPGITYAACQIFGVTGMPMTVAVLFMALPVAGASYVMSRQLGGDGPLMAGIITATTIAAGVTLPVVILLVG